MRPVSPRYRAGTSTVGFFLSDFPLGVIRVVPRTLFVPEAAYSARGFFVSKGDLQTMRQLVISDATMKQTFEDMRLNFKEKIELAKLLDKLGANIIELDGI